MGRRLLDWIGGALSGVAVYRFLQRRGRPADVAAEPEPAEERAEALRAKLDEIREEGEPVPAEPGEPEESVEERRRRVYEEGRARIDEMQGEE
jgi:hypothetical protein